MIRVAHEAALDVSVSERLIATPAEAEAARLPGSPTVRVRGLDVEIAARGQTDFGLG